MPAFKQMKTSFLQAYHVMVCAKPDAGCTKADSDNLKIWQFENLKMRIVLLQT